MIDDCMAEGLCLTAKYLMTVLTSCVDALKCLPSQ